MSNVDRRKILSFGTLALGALLTRPLTAAASEGTADPAWLLALENKLRLFAPNLSRVNGASGEIELHGTFTDLCEFANSHGTFAGLGVKISAHGNRLSFSKDSRHVAIILSTAPGRLA